MPNVMHVVDRNWFLVRMGIQQVELSSIRINKLLLI